MRRAVVTSMVLAAVGCGDRDAASEPAGIALPADPDAVVVRWSAPVGNGVEPGGTARLVITAGGAVYQAADSVEPNGLMAAPPEPASSDYVERRLEPAGLQRLLGRADDLGLLEPPPVYADIGVTDSASTEVVLATADGEFAHVAYALSNPGDESDDDRGDLARFVRELADLERTSGADLSPARPYAPAAYSAWLRPAEGADGVEWPGAVELTGECVAVPATEVAEIADGAATVDVIQDGAGYRVRLVPVLPVDEPCRP